MSGGAALPCCGVAGWPVAAQRSGRILTSRRLPRKNITGYNIMISYMPEYPFSIARAGQENVCQEIVPSYAHVI